MCLPPVVYGQSCLNTKHQSPTFCKLWWTKWEGCLSENCLLPGLGLLQHLFNLGFQDIKQANGAFAA